MAKQTAVYVRVSTTDQKHDSQMYELERYIKAHGLKRIKYYTDKASGGSLDRPGMDKLRADIFKGEVSRVLVYKIDRLARSLKDGVALLTDWLERGVQVTSVTQQIDISGTVGKMLLSILLGFAEMERETLRERVRTGIAARKAKGLHHGRQKGDTGHKWNPAKRKVDPALARSLRDQGVNGSIRRKALSDGHFDGSG